MNPRILPEKTSKTPDIATKAAANAWNNIPPVLGSIYMVASQVITKWSDLAYYYIIF